MIIGGVFGDDSGKSTSSNTALVVTESSTKPTKTKEPTATPEPTATDTPEPPPTPENIEPWRADLHAVVDVIRQACSGHVEIEDCLSTVSYVQQSLFLIHPDGQPICVAGARYVVMMGTQDIAWDVAGALVGGEHGTLAELYASIDALDTTIDEVLNEDCWFGFGVDDTPEPE